MMLEIRDSIIGVLKNQYPDHQIYDEKKTQGLKRPCFFVDLIPVGLDKVSPNIQERSMFVDIQYMSLEDTKSKNLEMAENLGQLFTHVNFLNKRVKVSDERFEVVDNILHYLFDLDFTLIGKQDEELPLMGELNLNEEV